MSLNIPWTERVVNRFLALFGYRLELKIILLDLDFGIDQEPMIDALIARMQTEGYVITSLKGNVRDGENTIPYIIEFKDIFSAYLFGHRQGSNPAIYF